MKENSDKNIYELMNKDINNNFKKYTSKLKKYK
jgi:hypothetical protein